MVLTLRDLVNSEVERPSGPHQVPGPLVEATWSRREDDFTFFVSNPLFEVPILLEERGKLGIEENHVTKSAFLSIVIGLLIFTDLSGRRTAAGADDEKLRRRTDPLVQPYLDNDMIVGMTIGVLREGKQQVFGYGRMSRDDRRVPYGDTIYEFGSATKVLTGILLADAVVQGRVKLDQPAGDLMPKGVKMPAKGNRAITLQDLSTHVSGLPRIPDNMKIGDLSNPYADYRKEDLYAFLNKHKLAQAPGTKSEYSNLGGGLLGYLLSLKAKSTYGDLVRNRIAGPLKMSSTKITIDKESQSRFAPGHLGDGQPAANWDFSVLAGAGGVRTTVNDMLLFAAANLARPKTSWVKRSNWPGPFIKSRSKRAKRRSGLVGIWRPTELAGTTVKRAAIPLDEFSSTAKTKSSVILLTNTATGEVDQLAADILRMISGAKVAPRKFEKTFDVPAEALQNFVGKYELAPGVLFTVETTDGKLMIGLTGQPSYQVFARSETVWYYKVVDATITFTVDKNGQCDSLVLYQNGIKQTAKRKK